MKEAIKSKLKTIANKFAETKNKLDINVERSSLKDEDLPYLDDKKLAILNLSMIALSMDVKPGAMIR